jgi:hypothetical protein
MIINSEDIFIVLDGKILNDYYKFPKYKTVFIFHRTLGGSDKIKINRKGLIRFNFIYEIGDAIAKLYLLIS